MNFQPLKLRAKYALKVFSTHLAISASIAAIISFLVLGHWFVYPYHQLLGGLHLFWLITAVDVTCGPLLTAIVWRPNKRKKLILLDVSVIGLLQCVALAYGIYTLSLARPLALVFEVDRFVAVTSAQVDSTDLAKAPPSYQKVRFLHHPWLLSVRQPISGEETLQSIELSMLGKEPSTRPDWWQSYDLSRSEVRVRMKPLHDLKMSETQRQRLLQANFMQGRNIAEVYYLPLVAHGNLDDWITVLNADADIIGYSAIGGFQDTSWRQSDKADN